MTVSAGTVLQGILMVAYSVSIFGLITMLPKKHQGVFFFQVLHRLTTEWFYKTKMC